MGVVCCRPLIWISFLLLSVAAIAQQTIEGKVIDQETGKPVPFASIGVVGTSKGTSSNVGGQFTLVLTGASTLKITCVGYETRLIDASEALMSIMLKPVATQLKEVFVFEKSINARKLVRKAFASIRDNYDTDPFLQNFFYRNYCKDDSVYGRLVEASVDVWKNRGYHAPQKAAGEKEQIRVTQLRRSIDKSALAQGHEPVLISNILQADLVAYQAVETKPHVSYYDDVNNLKIDFSNYNFAFQGITNYDGQEVYEIHYAYKTDSVLTVGGYVSTPTVKGALFITTDTYAIIKAEEERADQKNVLRTSAYYRKYNTRFYPYHLVREGKTENGSSGHHWYHVELMAVEIRQRPEDRFVGSIPGKAELLKIAYDSSFWKHNTILKTTPLEDHIIRDLGGGASLNEQFNLYHHYEHNTTQGGQQADAKFQWLKQYATGRFGLYVIFWSSDFTPYLAELEYGKRLNKKYRQQIKFVLISLDADETRWQQILSRYNLFSDGIIHYRVGQESSLAKEFHVQSAPAFILISKDGTIVDTNAKLPSNPKLVDDLERVIK